MFVEFVESSNDEYMQDANIVPYMEMNGVVVSYKQGSKKVAVIVYNPRKEKLSKASVISKVMTMFPKEVQANINDYSYKYSLENKNLCSATLIKIVNHDGELMEEFEEFANGGKMKTGGGVGENNMHVKAYQLTGAYGSKGIAGKVLFEFKKEVEKLNLPLDLNKALNEINTLWNKWSISEGAKIIENEVKQVYICLDKDARKQAIATADYFMANGVSVHFVDLEEKDPAEIGFERMCEIIRNTREMTSEDLMKEQIELLW
jgi:hypothetical protein